MNRDPCKQMIGPYLDGELQDQTGSRVEEHMKCCPACSAEADSLRALIARLEAFRVWTEISAPRKLWSAIQRRLRHSPGRCGFRPFHRLLQIPLALAASLALVLGTAGVVGVWLASSAQVARAESIDYSVLLNNLTQGLDTALGQFLARYHAELISVDRAHAEAPGLSFSLPGQLPQGQKLEQVYRFRFGSSTGIAARYGDPKRPVVVLFHRPAHDESLGAHASMPCIIGERHGEQIAVGPWRLVHFTDPTTCHCVLSTLEPTAELSVVVDAIAPASGSREGDVPH